MVIKMSNKFRKKHGKIPISEWSKEFQDEAKVFLEKRRKALAKYENDPIKWAKIHNKYAKMADELRDRATKDWELRQAILSASRHKN
jgi:hypothetical protein